MNVIHSLPEQFIIEKEHGHEVEKQEWSPFYLKCLQIEGKKIFVSPNWENNIQDIVRNFTRTLHSKWQEVLRFEGLERELLLIKERINKLEKNSQIIIPLEILDPESYDVIKPFNILIKPSGDEYISSFYDANLSTSGDTEEEAYDNLKEIIITIYEKLSRHTDAELGPGPLRQKKILNNFIKKK